MTYFTPRLVLNASPLPPLQLSFQDLPRGQSGSSLQQDGVGSTWLGPAGSGAAPPTPLAFLPVLDRSLMTLALVCSAGLQMLMAVALSVPFMSLVSVCPHALTGLHLFHSLCSLMGPS